MRILLRTLLVVSACAAMACERQPTATPRQDPAATARSESPLGFLELSMPTTELRTVDRIEVSITLDRERGVVAGEIEFDAEGAGWTVASPGVPVTNTMSGGGLRTVWRYELEPFLEGEYTIPPAAIELSRDGDEPVRLATPPQTVTVASVLAGEDEAQLAAPRPLVVSEPPADRRPYWFAGAVAAIVVVVLAAVIVTRRMARRPAPQPTPGGALGPRDRARAMQRRVSERVVALCGAAPQSPTTERLNAQIDACPWIRDRDGIKRLLVELEELVYGPRTPSDAEVADLEARTTRALAALDPSTPGEEVA